MIWERMVFKVEFEDFVNGYDFVFFKIVVEVCNGFF